MTGILSERWATNVFRNSVTNDPHDENALKRIVSVRAQSDVFYRKMVSNKEVTYQHPLAKQYKERVTGQLAGLEKQARTSGFNQIRDREIGIFLQAIRFHNTVVSKYQDKYGRVDLGPSNQGADTDDEGSNFSKQVGAAATSIGKTVLFTVIGIGLLYLGVTYASAKTTKSIARRSLSGKKTRTRKRLAGSNAKAKSKSKPRRKKSLAGYELDIWQEEEDWMRYRGR